MLGETNFRNQHQRFGIKCADRRHHLHLVGKTGTGKSSLIANLVRQDVAHGEGLALLNPHGDLVEELARSVPDSRKSDLIYFNATDPACPLAFNPLEVTQPGTKALVASGLISVFKKIWAESWGPRMEYILRNVFLALLDQPGSTLLDVPRLLDDPDFRSRVVARVQNAEAVQREDAAGMRGTPRKHQQRHCNSAHYGGTGRVLPAKRNVRGQRQVFRNAQSVRRVLFATGLCQLGENTRCRTCARLQ